MKIRIEPYKTWSGGARTLGERCGILRATRKQVAKHGDFDIIINWGRSERRFRGEYINDPAQVAVATDKRLAAEAFQRAEVPTPEFTTDREVAKAGGTMDVLSYAELCSGRTAGVVLFLRRRRMARNFQEHHSTPNMRRRPTNTASMYSTTT